MDTLQAKRDKATRKKQDHEVIFGFEYFVAQNLKLKCGFSTSRKFTPMIWMQQHKNNYIGIDKEEWMQLLTYKEFIQLKLDQYDFLMSDTILDHPTLSSIKCSFRFRKSDKQYVLVLNQFGNKIEIDSESWRSLIRLAIFFTTFLCWNTVLKQQITYLYYNHIIPKCVSLQKFDIQLSDLEGNYDKNVQIDLTRLCFEISKKMTKEIKEDVLHYKKSLISKNSNVNNKK